MSEINFPEWQDLKPKAGKFPPAAFLFVRDGLAHTVKLVHGEEGGEGDSRHVTGHQLCLGLRDFALIQYGRLARTVLRRWTIESTDDFGRIVYAMVEAGIMRKNEDDSLEHFRGVFDFDEAFGDLTTAV
ncbi:MAG: Minf_1886 family protein [Phycisphaerales bacterium]